MAQEVRGILPMGHHHPRLDVVRRDIAVVEQVISAHPDLGLNQVKLFQPAVADELKGTLVAEVTAPSIKELQFAADLFRRAQMIRNELQSKPGFIKTLNDAGFDSIVTRRLERAIGLGSTGKSRSAAALRPAS